MSWAFVLSGVASISIAASACSMPHPPKDGEQITLKHQTRGWSLDYSFSMRSPVWFFRRTKDSIDGVAWRSVSYHVMTPGIAISRRGHYDAIYRSDGKPIRHVRIDVTPFTRPLRAEYVPALTFSDGGIAFYSDDYAVIPSISQATVEALPDELDSAKIAEVAKVLTISDRQHPILLNGKISHGKATLALEDNNDGTYIYVGNTPVSDTLSFAEVIDPGLPIWIHTELSKLLPELMQFYTKRLGTPAGSRPTALVAWEGANRPGLSLGGSVLDRLVIMDLSGRQMLTPNDKVTAALRWFFGHETSHFWIGETIRYDRPSEGWITEGSADLLAIRAMQALVLGYDPKPKLQEEMTNCLTLNGAGKPLFTAESRGENKAQYACGALLSLVAEAAAKQHDQSSDIFSFVSGLIDANRSDGVVTEADWLIRFSTVAGASLTHDVATFIDKGVPDPIRFWSRLFGSVGVKVNSSGGTLHFE